MNVFTLPFMLHARKCQKKKKITPELMPTTSQMRRRHTHTGSNEQGLYTCTRAASMFVCFVFSSRCTARPWTAMKVMPAVLQQSWKCVTGGRLRLPAWNLQSPRRVQDRRDQPKNSGAQERASAARWKHTVHQHAAWTDMVSLRDVCHCCAVDKD